ncbi:class I SAM-dependent methyltransferase [Ectopseudomonas mendocina]|uniref:Class I SAM-dependent methyltransferase n=1 Tax=Ectopseudomonas mendocina TaxID=300 RepID=A0ABZ2RMG9_ECTME
MQKKNSIELEFSRKYDRDHAQQYFIKHQDGLSRRLSHWRDEQIARKALRTAGDPGLVLDLPCGAGRFWPVLAEQPERVIIAADNSVDMINVARASQSPDIVSRVKTFKASAFSIDLNENAVDCIFCIRLLHHFKNHEHRLAVLREFHRVSRDTLVVSLWVDGNFKSWRRRSLERRRAKSGRLGQNENRFVVSRYEIEQEFAESGWRVIGYQDFIPGYAMWRTYTLRKEI